MLTQQLKNFLNELYRFVGQSVDKDSVSSEELIQIGSELKLITGKYNDLQFPKEVSKALYEEFSARRDPSKQTLSNSKIQECLLRLHKVIYKPYDGRSLTDKDWALLLENIRTNAIYYSCGKQDVSDCFAFKVCSAFFSEFDRRSVGKA